MTRAEKAATELAHGIIEMSHLMYNLLTKKRFLKALVNVLQKELDKLRTEL